MLTTLVMEMQLVTTLTDLLCVCVIEALLEMDLIVQVCITDRENHRCGQRERSGGLCLSKTHRYWSVLHYVICLSRFSKEFYSHTWKGYTFSRKTLIPPRGSILCACEQI